MRILVLVLGAFTLASLLMGQRSALEIQHPLDHTSLQKAIVHGETLGKKSAGLKLGKSGENFKPMRNDSNRSNDFLQNTGSSMTTTGFGIEIFTPFTWLARGARDAADAGHSLDFEGLEDAYQAEVLRIIGYPDLPSSPTPGIYGDRVESITLRSTAKKNYEELAPSETKRISNTTRTLSGHILDMGPLVGAFALGDVQRISSLDKKGEFFVVLVSEAGKEKKFKVKKKHFDDLP